ncbi:hypothetical protein BDR04DRAFT_1096010 [Suillus decipiens]|nr:hypothetical protein BDR04DRAFT_1096010 [Suillus decipiens]
MSTMIALFPLNLFISSCLTDTLTAKNQAEFNSAFDALFARSVREKLSRDDYRAQLFSQSSATFEEKVASICIKDQLEVGGQMVSKLYSTISLKTFIVWTCRSILHVHY